MIKRLLSILFFLFVYISCNPDFEKVPIKGIYENGEEKLILANDGNYKQIFKLNEVNSGKYAYDSSKREIVFSNFLSLRCCFPKLEGWADSGEVFNLELNITKDFFNNIYLVPFEEDDGLNFKKTTSSANGARSTK